MRWNRSGLSLVRGQRTSSGQWMKSQAIVMLLKLVNLRRSLKL